MPTRESVAIGPYTTLRLGGPARRFLEAETADDVVAAVRHADRAGESVLVLGGGSNLVAPDEGFPGTVVRIVTHGIETEVADDRVLLRVQAGEDWDPFVARCVADGLAGVECLSGIPGLVGATPIQNVGAYGQEVSETVAGVRVYDRLAGEVLQLAPRDCGFGYRTSGFKGNARYVVLDVTFSLWRSTLCRPVRYAELARKLEVSLRERVPLSDARSAVLALRRGKGMVLDPADPDTRSAGSFFTNPVLSSARVASLEQRVAERLGPDVDFPRYPADSGRTKVSAAWLIERAGFPKGYKKGSVRISTKHTLALTNPDGTGTAEELLALAREVRDGVRDTFGIELVNEPVILGQRL